MKAARVAEYPPSPRPADPMPTATPTSLREITVRPTGLFSRTFRVESDDGELSILLRTSWNGGEARLGPGRRPAVVERKSIFSRQFTLRGELEARAHPRSVFSQSYDIECGPLDMTLEARIFSRAMRVLVDGREIGEILPDGLFGRGVNATLPVTTPPELVIFLVVLALSIRRARRSS